jgi:hypothetical protein
VEAAARSASPGDRAASPQGQLATRPTAGKHRELWAEAARYGNADSGQGRHAAGEGAEGTAQGGLARKLKKG